MAHRDEIEQAFCDMVKSLQCPGCELEFTEYAVDWGFAWCEGRRDLMDEHGWQERDGPFKLKCELCGHRSWLNYFSKSITSAERVPVKRHVKVKKPR